MRMVAVHSRTGIYPRLPSSICFVSGQEMLPKALQQRARVELSIPVLAQVVVFRLATILVLLSTPANTRGSRISIPAFRTATARAPGATSVRCGLFNYLSI